MKIAITMLLLLSAVGANAQLHSGGGATFNAGYLHAPRLSSVINSLAGDSIRIPRGYTKIGIEGFYFRRQATLVASAYLGVQDTKSPKRLVAEAYMWSAHIGAGWIVTNSVNLQVYPALGLGVHRLLLAWHERSSEETVGKFKTLAPSFDLALNINYIFIDSVTDGLTEGIVLSMKVGYVRSLFSTDLISPRQLQGWQISISTSGLGFFNNRH